MKKLLLTLFILFVSTVSFAQTVFTVTHDGKNYSFPLESKITVTNDTLWKPDTIKTTITKTDTIKTIITKTDTITLRDTLTLRDSILITDTLLLKDTIMVRDTMLVHDSIVMPVSIDSVEHYFYAAALQIYRQGSEEKIDTIYFQPMGDWAFIARDSSLKAGDEILLLYKRNASIARWTSVGPLNNRYNDYKLYATNRIASFGARNRWKVTKDPSITFAKKNPEEAVFMLTGNTMAEARLLAIGFGAEPTYSDTVTIGTTYNSALNGVWFTTASGNSQKSYDMSLVKDSIWAYTFNIEDVDGFYITEKKDGQVDPTAYTAMPLQAKGVMTPIVGRTWQSVVPHYFNGEVTIFYDERDKNYTVLGFKDTTEVEPLTSFDGTWKYKGNEIFTISNNTLHFASSLGLKESDYEITISGDTLILNPILSYDSENYADNKWFIAGSYSESYDKANSSNNGYITHDFILPQRESYFNHMKPVKLLLEKYDAKFVTDFQMQAFVVTDSNQQWYDSKESYLIDAGTVIYKNN